MKKVEFTINEVMGIISKAYFEGFYNHQKPEGKFSNRDEYLKAVRQRIESRIIEEPEPDTTTKQHHNMMLQPSRLFEEIELTPVNSEIFDQAENLQSQGLSKTDIIKKLGVSELTKCGWLKPTGKNKTRKSDPLKDEFLETAKELISKGFSKKETAKLLGLPTHKISYWIPNPRPIKAELLPKIKELSNMGYPYTKIGKMVGVSEATIANWINNK